MTEERSSLSKLRVKNERLKMYIGVITLVITNIATMATAVTAHMKEEKEETAKAAYGELSHAVESLSKEQVQMGKDLERMRGYLAGMANKQPVLYEEKTESKKPIVANIGGSVTVKPSKPVEAPPQIAAKPKEYKPPSISELKK